MGGYCSSFQEEVCFNTGLEDVSGLWEGHVTRLLEYRSKEDLFVRNTTRYILKGGN